VDGRRLSAIWDAMDEGDQLLLAGAHADAADTYGDSYSAAAGTVQFDEDLFETTSPPRGRATRTPTSPAS
jgi:hypothetical protein